MEKRFTRKDLSEILVKEDQKENSILYEILNSGEFTTLDVNGKLVYELVQTPINVTIKINLLKMYFQTDVKTSKGPVAIFEFILPAESVKTLTSNLSKTVVQPVDSDNLFLTFSLENKKKFDNYWDDHIASHSSDIYIVVMMCVFNHDGTLKQPMMVIRDINQYIRTGNQPENQFVN